jgi:hypothetical protein
MYEGLRNVIGKFTYCESSLNLAKGKKVAAWQSFVSIRLKIVGSNPAGE